MTSFAEAATRLEHEQPITLATAAVAERASCGSILRWIVTGRRGVRLDGLLIGGKWRTSREALKRFRIACSEQAARAATPNPQRSPTERERHTEAAKAEALRLLGKKPKQA